MGDDIHDVTQWLSRTPRAWRYRFSEDEGETSPSWDLNMGWAKALLASVFGWPEGRAKIGEGLALLPMQTRRKRETVYDLGGHMVDVPRMLAGDPLHMMSSRKRKRPTLVMSIVVNLSMNANVPADVCVNLGVALASMINALEDEGRRVELTLVHNSYVHSTEVCTGWTVKLPNQPLDLDQLAFAIAHPAAFRRIGFAMRERTAQHLQCEWYGSSTAVSPTMRKELNLPEDAVVIDAPDLWYECSTPASARAALAEKLGVE